MSPGKAKRIGPLLLTWLAMVGAASATDLYVNHCDALDEFSSGGSPAGPAPWLQYGGVMLDGLSAGYATLRLNPTQCYTNGTPIDITNGTVTVAFRYDGPQTTGTVGYWFRVSSGVWDGSQWVLHTQAGFFAEVPVNAGWTNFIFDVNAPDYIYQADPGYEWDPSQVYNFRLQAVIWDPGPFPYNFGMDELVITGNGQGFPVAVAGDDQLGLPCDCTSVTVDGSASYDTSPGGYIVRYVWKRNNQVVQDSANPVYRFIPPCGETTTMTLIVYDNEGNPSLPDSVLIQVNPGPATGYVNQFSTLDTLTFDAGVAGSVGYGGTAVVCNVTQNGYKGFSIAPCYGPINIWKGDITVTLRADGATLPAQVGFWLRVGSPSGGAGWGFQIPKNAGWKTIVRSVQSADYADFGFDPMAVNSLRLEAVVWPGTPPTIPYSWAVEHLEITGQTPQSDPPVANAGPDQGPLPCTFDGGVVMLDGSGSTDDGKIVRYRWTRGSQVLADTDSPTVTVGLPCGAVHTITLVVWDDEGQQSEPDTCEVTVLSGPPDPILDNVQVAFGIKNGDILGRAQHGAVLPAGNLELRVVNQRTGLPDPDSDRQLLFDVLGNIYFQTWYNTIKSLNPDLSDRWETQNIGGTDAESLIVGERYVYTNARNTTNPGGDPNKPVIGAPLVYAFSKTDGSRAWVTDLNKASGELWDFDRMAGAKMTLYDDVLYLIGDPSGNPAHNLQRFIYQINATTGAVIRFDPVDCGGRDDYFRVEGTVALVPDLYGGPGSGEHGLFFQERSEGESDGLADAVALQVSTGGVTQIWGADAGHADRSRAIYSAATNRVYMPNRWNWGGKSFWAFSVDADLQVPPQPLFKIGIRGGDYAAMEFDAGALSWDGSTVHTGGQSGWLYSYVDDGDPDSPEFTVQTRYYGDHLQWIGPRAILMENQDGDELLVTGAMQNWWGDPDTKEPTRVLILNLDQDPPIPPPTEEQLDDWPVYVSGLEIVVTDTLPPAGTPITGTTIYSYDFANLQLGPIDGQPYGPGYVSGEWFGTSNDENPAPQVVDFAGRRCVKLDPFGTDGDVGFQGWPFLTDADPFNPYSPAYNHEYVVFRWHIYRTDLTDNIDVTCGSDHAGAFAWDIDLKWHALGCCPPPSASQEVDRWQKVDRIYRFDLTGFIDNWLRIRVDDNEDNPAEDPAVVEGFPPLIDYFMFTVFATPPASHYQPPLYTPAAEYVANMWTGSDWDWDDVQALSVSPTGDIYFMQFKLYARRYTRLRVVPGAPPVCVGDLNCDGQIDFKDINPFVLYLSKFDVWQNTYPGCNPLNGDINGDGIYGFGSFKDINPFVTLLASAPLPIPCP
jgi:hypothetical protein